MAGLANALSVDIEDWYQVGAFENTIRREDWGSLENRVERNTNAVLDLFDRCGVKGTFFTLGGIAMANPAIIRKIVDAGHELASHGWDHQRVFQMTPDMFRADVDRTKMTLEDLGGVKVRGYRAPSFSIDQRTPWAHQILAETGHSYSSSVAPIKHDHYGWADAPRYAFKPLPDSDFIELPPSVTEIGSKRIATGGGFFRLLPFAFSRWAVSKLNMQEQQPAIFYFHPWEIDPGQPRVDNAPLKSRIRHYSRLGAMEGKLELLLKGFAWDRTDHIVAREVEALK